MVIAKTTKIHQSLRSKVALVSAVSLSLVVGSVAVGAPAHATGSLTSAPSAQASSVYVLGDISARKPHVIHLADGTRLVAYPGKVFFPSGGYWVQVKQERWEKDLWPDADDHLGTTVFTRYIQNTGTYKFRSMLPLKKTDFGYGDKTEEVYHKVSYRVFKNGSWSPWSKWVFSPIASIPR